MGLDILWGGVFRRGFDGVNGDVGVEFYLRGLLLGGDCREEGMGIVSRGNCGRCRSRN